MRSYGFATHVWEMGGRDFARIEMVSLVDGSLRGSSIQKSHKQKVQDSHEQKIYDGSVEQYKLGVGCGEWWDGRGKGGRVGVQFWVPAVELSAARCV